MRTVRARAPSCATDSIRPESRPRARRSSTCCSSRPCMGCRCGGRWTASSTRRARPCCCDWLGTPPKFDREQALGELARRYLAGHAPADERDLARWAGLPLRDVRTGLKTISRRLRSVPTACSSCGAGGRVSSATGDDAAEELPPPRLLGFFRTRSCSARRFAPSGHRPRRHGGDRRRRIPRVRHGARPGRGPVEDRRAPGRARSVRHNLPARTYGARRRRRGRSPLPADLTGASRDLGRIRELAEHLVGQRVSGVRG